MFQNDFAERLYTLRREKGLSQEQLAEKLNVSRQAVSKWESGTSLPESDKLLAIADFFGVSMDELVRGKTEETPAAVSAPDESGKGRFAAGLAVCIAGVVGLLALGILAICLPERAAQIGASSMITIDGIGIGLLLAAAAVVVGTVLLLRKK